MIVSDLDILGLAMVFLVVCFFKISKKRKSRA
jgi:hypothetical protein